MPTTLPALNSVVIVCLSQQLTLSLSHCMSRSFVGLVLMMKLWCSSSPHMTERGVFSVGLQSRESRLSSQRQDLSALLHLVSLSLSRPQV